MRCEGWTRHGGAFSFGPVKWTQCKNSAVVLLTVVQDDGETEQPACIECWDFAMGYGIKIKSARPINTVDTDEE